MHNILLPKVAWWTFRGIYISNCNFNVRPVWSSENHCLAPQLPIVHVWLSKLCMWTAFVHKPLSTNLWHLKSKQLRNTMSLGTICSQVHPRFIKGLLALCPRGELYSSISISVHFRSVEDLAIAWWYAHCTQYHYWWLTTSVHYIGLGLRRNAA